MKINTVLKNLVVGCLFQAASTSYAQSVSISGENIDVNLPSNFCTLSPDSNFYKLNEVTFGRNLKLALVSAPCTDIEALQNGQTSSLKHYIAIEQITIKGQLVKFPLGDFAYVALVTAYKPTDLTNVTTHLNNKVAKFGVEFKNLSYKIIKTTSSAAFMYGKAQMVESNTSKDISVLAGTKLVREIPVGVHVYDENITKEQQKNTIEEFNTVFSSL